MKVVVCWREPPISPSIDRISTRSVFTPGEIILALDWFCYLRDVHQAVIRISRCEQIRSKPQNKIAGPRGLPYLRLANCETQCAVLDARGAAIIHRDFVQVIPRQFGFMIVLLSHIASSGGCAESLLRALLLDVLINPFGCFFLLGFREGRRR